MLVVMPLGLRYPSPGAEMGELHWVVVVIPILAMGAAAWAWARTSDVHAVTGAIELDQLPPNYGMILSVCFFPVATPDAPAPFGGEPPPEAATDCHQVVNDVALDAEHPSTNPLRVLRFEARRPRGYYFLQVRAILFRRSNGRMLAQSEQFFFGERPLAVPLEPEGSLALPLSWPRAPVDELHYYHTIKPLQ